ncbi:hypothetical protein PUP68_12065 [Pseudomonas chlororaphis]|uniref:hypothetical protein n=1 Tax=Pseudomonas chlororaphis TaxID=587753 RepID=UPI002368CC8E|nr:hypothetical protein [Pseudomonas chlororaphis]WDG79142.1 hypothetical protein PUP77_00175 [Pseudomonas chlororaphis]WDG87806.1 hypothetical protein PUP68_12065 [Pseudomonas chlororaphis]
MKISDLDVLELLEVITKAISPVIFKGIDQDTAPHLWRERMKLNAEIVGRITAVLHCGDEVGPDIRDLIEICTRNMHAGYEQSFSEVLGPGGSLSKIRKP